MIVIIVFKLDSIVQFVSFVPIVVLAFLEKYFLVSQEVKTTIINQRIYYYQFVVNYTYSIYNYCTS